MIVATSRDLTDSPLVDVLRANGITYYRGDLEDVLGRLVSALIDYPDSTNIFRLTADNVFPDGTLLDAVEHDFVERKVDYLCCNGRYSGLPYGMSVEIFRLGHLREANSYAESGQDREHVTPWIIRKYSGEYFDRFRVEGSEGLRCTIDYLDDYVRLARLFNDVADPINIDSLELVKLLERQERSNGVSTSLDRLILGTAQLGLTYGIANRTGQPTKSQAVSLVKLAVATGVGTLDTARVYGSSETVIGEALVGERHDRISVITKVGPFSDFPSDANTDSVHAFVEASVYRSMHELRRRSLDVLLLHRADLLDRWRGDAWRALCAMKDNGTVGTLGASVQSAAELQRALREPEIAVVQLPFNLLDWRWDDIIPLIRTTKTQRRLVIHVRSVFLQGLLVSPDTSIWRRVGGVQLEFVLEWLREQVRALGRESAADLCIAFVRSLDWVDGIVVGAETIAQLEDNVRLFNLPVLSDAHVQAIERSRPIVPARVLDPASWGTA